MEQEEEKEEKNEEAQHEQLFSQKVEEFDTLMKEKGGLVEQLRVQEQELKEIEKDLDKREALVSSAKKGMEESEARERQMMAELNDFDSRAF